MVTSQLNLIFVFVCLIFVIMQVIRSTYSATICILHPFVYCTYILPCMVLPPTDYGTRIWPPLWKSEAHSRNIIAVAQRCTTTVHTKRYYVYQLQFDPIKIKRLPSHHQACLCNCMVHSMEISITMEFMQREGITNWIWAIKMHKIVDRHVSSPLCELEPNKLLNQRKHKH